MAAILIRFLGVVLGVAFKAAYLFSLYVLTFAACFMRDVGCPQGWLFRTAATVTYLVLVAGLMFVVRRLLGATTLQDEMLPPEAADG
jgi:uncharacterized membrane protein YcjF (UPF0283 family)